MSDEARHKLQSSENLIDAMKTYQIPDDYKLVSFDVKSLMFVRSLLQLRTERQGVVYKNKCYNCQSTYIGETGEKLRHVTD